jgi:hypothetical protein
VAKTQKGNAYSYQEHAENYARRLRKRGALVEVYSCPYCGLYHVGGKKKKSNRRHRKQRKEEREANYEHARDVAKDLGAEVSVQDFRGPEVSQVQQEEEQKSEGLRAEEALAGEAE